MKRPREVRDALRRAYLLILEAEEGVDEWISTSRNPQKLLRIKAGVRLAKGSIEDVIDALPTPVSGSGF